MAPMIPIVTHGTSSDVVLRSPPPWPADTVSDEIDLVLILAYQPSVANAWIQIRIKDIYNNVDNGERCHDD